MRICFVLFIFFAQDFKSLAQQVFPIAADDAAITSAKSEGCLPHSLLITLKNPGSTILTSVDIEFLLNGTLQPVYHWTGTLATDSTANIIIPNGIPSWDSVNMLIVYTKFPNGNADGNPSNDTLTTEFSLPRLNGVYHIGNAAADFKSFFDVFAALRSRGICGPVVFKIHPEKYYNFKGIDLTLDSIAGNNATNTITFESINGINTSVEILFSVINLNNVVGLSFRNMSFDGIFYLKNARSLLFDGNRFSAHSARVISSSEYCEDIRFINNHCLNAHNFLQFSTKKGVTSPKNILIKGNTFRDATSAALAFFTNIDSLIIDSNYFYKKNSNYYVTAIEVNNHDYFKISRNTITGTFKAGISLLASDKGTYNKLKPSVENNAIIIEQNHVMSGCEGIIVKMDSLNIFYNSVYCASTYIPLTVYGFADSICNNIFSADKGCASKMDGVHNTMYADHNIYYTTSENLMMINGNMYADLAAYNAVSGFDAHSHALDPQFVSLTTDLHYLNKALDGKAIPLPSVLTDLTGIKRHPSTPNPGAYETGSMVGIDESANHPNITVAPNPFIENMTISYGLHAAGDVGLYIYNALGQCVNILVSGYQPAGEYRYTFSGETICPGIYYLRMIWKGQTYTKRIVSL